MMRDNHLCQMPQLRKVDASLLRRLINHVSRHMNALQTLPFNVTVQYLKLNNLLATLEPETQREWELITASRADISKTEKLITILEIICKILQLLQTTQSLKVIPITSRYSHITGNMISKIYSIVVKQLQCTLCDE